MFGFRLPAIFLVCFLMPALAAPAWAEQFDKAGKQALDKQKSKELDREQAAIKQLEKILLASSYQRAWQLLRDNSMYPERLKGWSCWQHRFDGKLRSKKELQEAVNLMLEEIHDEYTYFRDVEETTSSHRGDEESAIVTARLLPRNYAYIAIRSFTSMRTADELELALSRLSNSDSLILDLRGNRGGYVEQALSCFELLCEQGKFVSMVGREDGKPYKEVISLDKEEVKREINGQSFSEQRRRNLSAQKPMLVLIDKDTRSAAEMLAGALKDTRKATLLGNRSFGKGIVQSTWYLEPGCSLRIAMARYYLPSNQDINGVGICPDYQVQFQKEAGSDQDSGGLSDLELSTINKALPAYLAKSASN